MNDEPAWMNQWRFWPLGEQLGYTLSDFIICINMGELSSPNSNRLHHTANLLLPPSAVSRPRTLTFKCSSPSFFALHCVFPSWSILSSTSRMADGANSSASPTLKRVICAKMPSSAPSDRSSFAAAAAKWCFNVWSQSGELKRCTRVIVQRSRRRGEMVGSCVAMTIRQARWRWSRTAAKRELVSLLAAVESFMNCRFFSRYRMRLRFLTRGQNI